MDSKHKKLVEWIDGGVRLNWEDLTPEMLEEFDKSVEIMEPKEVSVLEFIREKLFSVFG